MLDLYQNFCQYSLGLHYLCSLEEPTQYKSVSMYEPRRSNRDAGVEFIFVKAAQLLWQSIASMAKKLAINVI